MFPVIQFSRNGIFEEHFIKEYIGAGYSTIERVKYEETVRRSSQRQNFKFRNNEILDIIKINFILEISIKVIKKDMFQHSKDKWKPCPSLQVPPPPPHPIENFYPFLNKIRMIFKF